MRLPYYDNKPRLDDAELTFTCPSFYSTISNLKQRGQFSHSNYIFNEDMVNQSCYYSWREEIMNSADYKAIQLLVIVMDHRSVGDGE